MTIQSTSAGGRTFFSAFSLQGKLFDPRAKKLALTIFNGLKNIAFYAPHRIAGICVLPSQIFSFSFDHVKKRTTLKDELGGEEVYVPASDGTLIHAMYFLGEGCQKSSRTIIFFNANAGRYEDYPINHLKRLQKQGWNILIFNYRNVFTNKCLAACDGLVLDGEAVFHHIKDTLKVPENKILLHGHSLGGGIASEVAANHPLANYCNDRSFVSLSKQVKVMFGNGIIGSVISNVLYGLGWEYDTLRNWDKIKGVKIVVYHDNDGMISRGARLHEFLDQNIITIKMSPGKLSGNTLIGDFDNNEVIDNILKKYKPSLKHTIDLLLLKLRTGRIAHIRDYQKAEKLDYIEKINVI